jgi:preprotein translocase subunit SecF
MSQHKFRYLLPPGSDFKFVAKFRGWMLFSFFAIVACISVLFINKSVRGDYMNWTIDFKGGTEVIYAFKTKDGGGHKRLDAAAVRGALKGAGEVGFDVSEMGWTGDDGKEVSGLVVRTPRFSSVKREQTEAVTAAVTAQFAALGIEKANWSGERLFLRTKQPVTDQAGFAAIFAANGLEMKPWTEEDLSAFGAADEGTGEFSSIIGVWGIDRQLAGVLAKVDASVDVEVVQAYGVGAKAGDKLRDDAAKSLVFAILLIMLYLAFRFDIRYAPGAAFATVHDAIMVIGVFAVTWTEVSLTSVAALLTVVGFSVNDTVVIFDRIRENQVKLKDKKLDRIIDISINETLVRSIMTSLTVFAITLLMNIFGEGLIRNFAFAMNVGVIVGTYSSIFLAAPVFLWISRKWYSGVPEGAASARAAHAAAVAAEP